jgi:hypothetical protein
MYFSAHPTTTYNNSQVIDIFRRVITKFNILENIAVFQKYDIVDGASPEALAFKLYGDSELHWVILLSNNIVDVNNNWPLSTQDFGTYVTKKYTNPAARHHYEDGDGDVVDGPTSYPVSYFTFEERKNDEKASIFVLDASYISSFVEEFRKLIK